MTKYVCGNCEKIFHQKSNYDSHMNRKYPCKKKDSTNEEINKTEELTQDKFDLLIKKLEEIQKDCEDLKKDNENFKNEIIHLKSITNGKNIQGDDKSKNIQGDDKSKNLYITINQFGKENEDFIDLATAKKILNKGYEAVPELIKTLHFDENRQENHNVYMPNWRDNNVLVYDGANWNLQNRNTILDDLKNKGVDFIQTKYDDLNKNDKNDMQIITKIDRFLNSYNTDQKDQMDTLNKDIMFVLYNNKHIPEKTRNQNKKIVNTPTKVKK